MYIDERAIIKLASKPMCDSEDLSKINILCKEKIDWGYLFYIMLHHRITAIVYSNLERASSLMTIEKHVRRAMKTECIRIAEKNKLLLNEINNINDMLAKNNIYFVNIKGAILAHRLYPSTNFREFTDIDLLIKKEDAVAVSKCLNKLGYIQGQYDFNSNTIKPYTRKEIIKKAINSHESAEFVKLANSRFFSSVIVDLNYNIIWNEHYKKDGCRVDLITSNERESVSLNGIQYFHLLAEDELLQLCCHLYSEAVFFMFDPFWKRDKTDLNIIKLCDIYLLIRKCDINWDEFRTNVISKGLVEPVCYALDCVEQFYDDMEIPFDIHNFFGCKMPKERLLNKYYDKNFCAKFWNCSYEERLFNMQKKYIEVIS